MWKSWTSPRPKRVSLHLWVYRHRIPILSVAGALVLAVLLGVGYFTSVVVSRFEGTALESAVAHLLRHARTARRRRRRSREADGQARPAALPAGRDAALASRPLSAWTGRPSTSLPAGSGIRAATSRGFRPRSPLPADGSSELRDGAGDRVPAVVVEPELLGSVFGDEIEDRTLVRLSDVPKTLTDAILVTEDRDFYRHAGVSMRRTFGAVFSNLKGGATQGGSTLTQQLVKNLYLSPERTHQAQGDRGGPRGHPRRPLLQGRDLRGLPERDLSRPRRVRSTITGVGEAARHYFGKEASDLDLAESATLAAIIKAPNVYSPLRNPARATQRRDLVLRLMREEKKIDDAAAARRRSRSRCVRRREARSRRRRRTSWISSRASSPSATARS